MTKPLPTLFISHGSPMHALDAGAVGEAWAALGRRYPDPKAILVASAHWDTQLPTLTGSAQPETIHDFYGFPAPLYRIRYAAPGAPEVAVRAQQLLQEAAYTAAIDGSRGLDHGAWSPLLHSHPAADVPVLQISLQTALGTSHHLRLGRALAPLADEGVEELLSEGLFNREGQGPQPPGRRSTLKRALGRRRPRQAVPRPRGWE